MSDNNYTHFGHDCYTIKLSQAVLFIVKLYMYVLTPRMIKLLTVTN